MDASRSFEMVGLLMVFTAPALGRSNFELTFDESKCMTERPKE
jgi:hypothetical protein